MQKSTLAIPMRYSGSKMVNEEVTVSFLYRFTQLPSVLPYNITMQKKFIMLGMVIGSVAGSYIPLIWGDSAFSMSSLFFGALGGFIGIWAGYKVANWL